MNWIEFVSGITSLILFVNSHHSSQYFCGAGVVMMELAGGGSLSETLYNKVSAESTLGGTRTALGDVPWCSVPCNMFVNNLKVENPPF